LSNFWFGIFNKLIIVKGGGGSIYSDAMSQRSKMSKFSSRGHSLNVSRHEKNPLEKIPENDEQNLSDGAVQ